MDCAELIVPASWVAKVRLVVGKVAFGPVVTPVLLRLTDCGLPAPFVGNHDRGRPRPRLYRREGHANSAARSCREARAAVVGLAKVAGIGSRDCYAVSGQR